MHACHYVSIFSPRILDDMQRVLLRYLLYPGETWKVRVLVQALLSGFWKVQRSSSRTGRQTATQQKQHPNSCCLSYGRTWSENAYHTKVETRHILIANIPCYRASAIIEWPIFTSTAFKGRNSQYIYFRHVLGWSIILVVLPIVAPPSHSNDCSMDDLEFWKYLKIALYSPEISAFHSSGSLHLHPVVILCEMSCFWLVPWHRHSCNKLQTTSFSETAATSKLKDPWAEDIQT